MDFLKRIKTYLQTPPHTKADAPTQIRNQDWHYLLTKINTLQHLNQRVLPYLDANIQPYCQVANKVGDKLVMVANNGSVATQLHLQSADLLIKFRQDPLLNNIRHLSCKVQVFTSIAQGQLRHYQPIKMAPLSLQSAETLQQMADSLTDPKLKAIIKKIAAHVEK